ncbi:hypothetical protein M153_55770001309, partial [Pseudoloma neurophilia]
KPSDFDDDFPFLLKEPKEIKMLLPLDEYEMIIWEEKKLNSSASIRKKTIFEDKKKRGWNLDVCDGFFDSKGNFIADRTTVVSTNDPEKFAPFDTNDNSQYTIDNISAQKSPPNEIFTKNSSFVFESNTRFEPRRTIFQRSEHSTIEGPSKGFYQATQGYRRRFNPPTHHTSFNNTYSFQNNSFNSSKQVTSHYKNPFSNDRSNENIRSYEPKIETLWFFKNDTDLKGPLSTTELLTEMKHSDGLAKIKKLTDKFFVECTKQTETEIEEEYKTNKDLIEQSKSEEINKSQPEELKPQIPSPNQRRKSTLTLTISDRLEKCQKSQRFLKRAGITIQLEEIFDLAKNKTKNEFINSLFKETAVNKRDLEDFTDCFLEEIGIQVVTDIDKDGFVIPQKSKKN